MHERLRDETPGSTAGIVYKLPLREGHFLASFTLPRDLTRAEAARIMQMLQTLILPEQLVK